MNKALFPISTAVDRAALRKSAGFYKLTDAQGEAKYVGSASNLETRLHAHNHSLRKGDHPNKSLQQFVLEGGQLQFVPHIMPSKEEALEMEQAWLADPQLRSQLFNVATNARSALKDESVRLHKQSPEHVAARFRNRAPVSVETKARLTFALKKPVIVHGVEYPSAAEAGQSLGISRSLVSSRCSSDKFPEWTKKHG